MYDYEGIVSLNTWKRLAVTLVFYASLVVNGSFDYSRMAREDV